MQAALTSNTANEELLYFCREHACFLLGGRGGAGHSEKQVFQIEAYDPAAALPS